MPRDLVREVFGGSESELSSDEGDISRQQVQKTQKTKVVQPSREDAYESSAGDSEDEYQEQRTKPSQGKRPSTVRRRLSTDGKTVQRKRKRREPVEVDLSELPPEQANKIRLDMQIEAILKPKKTSRHRKKKANEEVLDSFADDEVARLREAMNAAADEDQRANMEKLPATAKLKLLPEAMETLQKASLAQSMIDNNLLEAVRRWLEPLPDRSLPALNIQREFFTILRKMEFIDSAVLKESGLGKVVLFYTKCKRVTPDISRVALELVSTWSRPIIKRSASYRDKVVPVVADFAGDGEGGGSQPARGEKLNAILARAKESEKHRVKKNAVSIPQRELGNYTVAPRPNAGLALGLGRGSASVDEDVERRKKNAERLRMLTRKVGGMK
ncbi:putative TFIIS helical bundle-like domain containing protein [Lyophyllum shimeji]|uniref:TFIIS helical bundle-like domain containing protein n=1 Tax=Lyophyllum shimeji TaxID=47721 RepID=A0A9P3PQV7_LYOSH|nr:putative TFIIS helical bundle-like domain containing protein [Lyophyllum shimeji]